MRAEHVAGADREDGVVAERDPVVDDRQHAGDHDRATDATAATQNAMRCHRSVGRGASSAAACSRPDVVAGSAVTDITSG